MSTNTWSQLVSELQDVRQQWRSNKLLEGSLLTVALVIGVLLLLVLADNLWQPGVLGRLLLATVLWGAAAMTVSVFIVRRWVDQKRDDYFAVLVENRHPELGNQLINALQLGRGGELGSPQIIDAVVEDATRSTIDLDMTDCVDWQPVRRALVSVGVVALVMLGYGVGFTPLFANGLGRVLLPAAGIEPYRSTEIVESSIQPKDGKRYPEGSTIDVSVEVGGRVVPQQATLHVSRDSEDFAEIPLLTDPASRSVATRSFALALPDVSRNFEFFVTAGDDVSGLRSIEIVKRPRVDNLAIQTTPPEYTGLPSTVSEETSGDFAALPASSVQLTVSASKTLRSATLEAEDGTTINLTKSSEARTWRTSFVVWSSDINESEAIPALRINAPSRYRLRLIDTDGYENAEPIWHAVTLLRDQAPTIAIPVPGRDVQFRPSDPLALTIAARDDYGLADVRVLYRVNDGATVHELSSLDPPTDARVKVEHQVKWTLAEAGVGSGDLVQFWAAATARNELTGPGESVSRRYTIFVVTPEEILARLELQSDDYEAVLTELIRLQRTNRVQTASGGDFAKLIQREARIRTSTAVLARAMRKATLPTLSMIDSLDVLHAGPMADVIRLLETGRDSAVAQAAKARDDSLPVQDAIVAELERLLERLRRNNAARKELRRIRKKDEAIYKDLTDALGELASDLRDLIIDQTELVSKLEKMPKKPVDELNEEELGALKDFDEFEEKWSKWKKGTVDDLTKLPTGFIDDFGLRSDVNTVFEEIEAVAKRPKTTKLEVALEDAGSSKATEMLEDLETWMPDAPDALQWVMEEPLDQKPMQMPEMPLPDALEDLIGDLLQEAEEFDEEADDITSAWGDNLNQAGWGVSDGPISNFSAKGKTGNDLPNNHEVTGRAGDGRRGKSTGQMVGDTARGLEGRKTPARLNNERYEPGKLKEEGRLDPNGSTGGGKKAGAGQRGLQGGTPPDFVKEMERLSTKQTGMREKAEQIARQLNTDGISGRRLNRAIELMESVEDDLRDLRYEDAARKRKVAMRQLKAAFSDFDRTTGVQLSQARDLPPELREELLQSADEGFPDGYESLLENYYRALSEAEK